jgi:peroxiredoxin Q/BCP
VQAGRKVRFVALIATLFITIGAAANAQPLQVGDRAPDFTLPATTGGVISLSDYRGERMVLIEFYHSDWGPNCTLNLSQRRDDYQQFAELGVEVIAIALDNAYSQAAFAQSLNLPYPLLSDYPHGRTIQAYGVGSLEGDAGRLFARPSFFLIDKEGIIRGYWGQRPRNPEEVLPPDPLVSSRPMLDMARALAQ